MKALRATIIRRLLSQVFITNWLELTLFTTVNNSSIDLKFKKLPVWSSPIKFRTVVLIPWTVFDIRSSQVALRLRRSVICRRSCLRVTTLNHSGPVHPLSSRSWLITINFLPFKDLLCARVKRAFSDPTI